MIDSAESIVVRAAEVYRGDAVIHFSNGTSVLYHARFLNSAQHSDGNIALPDEEDKVLDGVRDEEKG